MSDLPKNIKMDNETINPSFGCPACMTYFTDSEEKQPNPCHENWEFNCPKCNSKLDVNRKIDIRVFYTVETPELENAFLEVDEFLDDFIIPSKENVGERYAQFVLEFMRAPAAKKYNVERWTKQFKLFCTYNDGLRYRITGASRMGDVWLAKDENKDSGYDLRVCIKDCSEFSPEWAFYYNEQGDLTGFSIEKIEEIKHG